MYQDKIYVGVYAIFLKNDELLMIKKARGPYSGRYDLPGGGLEFGENVLDCLKREISEEVGAQLESAKFYSIGEYNCQYNKDGELRNFQHLALYYLVELNYSEIKTLPDGQDSLGAVFIKLQELNQDNCAQVLLPIIDKIKAV